MSYTITKNNNDEISYNLSIENISLEDVEYIINMLERNDNPNHSNKIIDIDSVLKTILGNFPNSDTKNKIIAIKVYKNFSGQGLVESKMYVENLMKKIWIEDK